MKNWVAIKKSLKILYWLGFGLGLFLVLSGIAVIIDPTKSIAANSSSVPTIPEPETYLLIAVILGVFIWLLATRKLF